jgi:hypothetical protein
LGSTSPKGNFTKKASKATLSGDIRAGLSGDLPTGSAKFRQPAKAVRQNKAGQMTPRLENMANAQPREKVLWSAMARHRFLFRTEGAKYEKESGNKFPYSKTPQKRARA